MEENPNSELFKKYLILAAEYRNEEAMFLLAMHYKNGSNGFEKDNIKAFAWFLESGYCLVSNGFLEVGKYLVFGSDCGLIPKNHKAAEAYLNKVEGKENEIEKNKLLQIIEMDKNKKQK